MKAIKIPPSLERTGLMKGSTEEWVELVLHQQESITKLVEEIERLKVNANTGKCLSANILLSFLGKTDHHIKIC